MYWPTTTAKRLHLSPAGVDELAGEGSKLQRRIDSKHDDAQQLPDQSAPVQKILHIGRSRNGHLWAAVSADTLSIWNTRPSQIVAALVRTQVSLSEHGQNCRVQWTEDGLGLVVETDQSFLLLYTLAFRSDRESQIYSYIPSSGSGAKSRITKEPLAPSIYSLKSSFAAGPGEGSGAMANELKGAEGGGTQSAGEGKQAGVDVLFKLVLRIDAKLSCIATTREHLLVATQSPPAVQCIPWPGGHSSKATSQTRTSLVDRLKWVVPSQREEVEEGEEGRESKEIEPVFAKRILHSRAMDMYVWLTSDGRAYCANLELDSRTSIWRGKCFHGAPKKRRRRSSGLLSRDTTHSSSLSLSISEDFEGEKDYAFAFADQAVCASINAKFSLIAVGLQSGIVVIYTYRAPDKAALYSHSLSIRKALRSTASYLTTGPCTTLAWSSDGHGLAVGWERGWSIWSTYGKLMGCSMVEDWQEASTAFSDVFMKGVREMFWGPGNTELFLLCNDTNPVDFDPDLQLFVLPFAKSAVAGQHSPDNTRYAFIQLDDSVLVYRGSDQPDMSIINPESDVWHHIRIPQTYLASNWPIRYACISGDGRLIAVAGRRGVCHFSSLSGRWKQYSRRTQEQAFSVRGGLQWYQHVLVVACHIHSSQTYELRLYSRDSTLDDSNILYREQLPSAVILTSLFDNSLLVYTADNTLYHFLIAITSHEIRLTICGSITFEGVVGEPARVRGMSWLIPPSQQRFGDPMDDLTVATVIFLIDGKLVLLRPRRGHEEEEEVSYDLQILGDKIEYYWTHLQGIGTLENSLWGYDGHGIKIWLDALTIESAEKRVNPTLINGDEADMDGEEEDEEEKPEYKTIEESVTLPLDFYPLCVLIEKGIVIGVEPEVSLRRSLDFAIFRSTTNTHLFLHHILRKYLEKGLMNEAVIFASFYTPLVYFSHALEILLHDVLEDEADALEDLTMSSMPSNGSIVQHESMTPSHSRGSLGGEMTPSNSFSSEAPSFADSDASTSNNGREMIPERILPIIVAFLDHFSESLEVVVNCARKSEVARWKYLFSIVGDPKELFEICLHSGNYKTAGSYLLVLHNLETIEASKEYTIRLLVLAKRHGWNNLCKDLLRFTRSLDDDGKVLRDVVRQSGLLESSNDNQLKMLRLPQSSELLSSGRHGQLGLLQRASSAPNVLDSTPEEEERDDTSRQASHQQSPPHYRSLGQRSMSMLSSGHENGVPIPQLSVNGRIMPTNAPMSRSSSSGSSHGISGGVGSQSPNQVRRSPSMGLGMSLSRVGLRSTDRLWEGSPQ
ncbi:hypothetical protein CBS101457_004638 [Exobasidium rhododendri]|nr:hypothetical protein CBS101457_004638 [Exobasidium rhododendri]